MGQAVKLFQSPEGVKVDDLEYAERAEAWTWCARTLGQEVDLQRIDGLVEITAGVRSGNLKESIQRVMKSSPSDFLPSPGLVIAAANKIAGEQREEAQRALSEHRRATYQLEASVSRATPEQVAELRERISELARQSKYGESKPWTEKLKGTGGKGIEAVRKFVSESPAIEQRVERLAKGDY